MFLHPFLLAIGLAGASLPILVHFLTRPKPIQMPLSTIHLVADALAGRRSRDRLRDFLILLLRSLAMALLAIAIARPLMMGDAKPNDPPPADRIRVVLVDASGSMAAIEGASTRFDRARAAAVKELKFRSGLSANVLIASQDPGAIFQQPSANLTLLRQRLGEAVVSDAAMNVAAAIDEAGRQLSMTGGGESPETDSGVVRELVIISDFQRTNWARAEFASLPDDVEVRLVPLGSKPLGNVAIADVRLSASATFGKPVSLAVDIANHSDNTRIVKCAAEIGMSSPTSEATIGPYETVTLSLPVQWADAGWQTGRVRLIDNQDARPIDDVYPLAVGVRSELRYAVVTDASLNPGVDADFVAKVLQRESSLDEAPGEAESRVAVLTSNMLDTPPAQIANIWILSDVQLWNERVAKQVAAWLRQGKAILYLAGNPADANQLQELETQLGGDLQSPVQLIASLESATRSDLRLDETDGEHLPLRVFGSLLDETVSAWRVGGGLPTRLLDSSGIDRVAATLSDRSVLLYFADVGAGRLGVLNADLTRSNLAYQAGFVPFLVETIHRLTDASSNRSGTTSGQPVYRELPGPTGSVGEFRIVRDAGASGSENDDDSAIGPALGTIQNRDGLTIWNWPVAQTQGVYRVLDGKEQTAWAEAVVGDANEQDLSSLSTDVVQTRLAGGRELRLESSEIPPGREDTMWVWAVLGMLACVVGEWATLLGFRS